MFKQFYGLSFNPFDKGLKENDAYLSKDLKEMISRLEYLDKTRGIGVFTATSGSGKTFALRCFKKKLNSNLTKIIYLSFSTITTTEFYRQLSLALGLEAFAKKSDMFKSIQDYMNNMLNDKRIHYIIALDEAQYLNSDILKDLKMLMNFYMDSKDCFSLVLIGQPVLNNILEKQIHESLKQRIVINYDFEGLTESETEEYVKSRLSLVEVSNKIIDENAIKALHGCSSGSIRKLNSIITKALLIGAQHEKSTIDTNIIMAASNELSLR